MLPKPNRITKSIEFSTIFQKGKRTKENSLILHVLLTRADIVRIGVVISKKNVQKATARNRLRRIITETMRQKLSSLKKGSDMVFVVLHPAVEEKPSEIRIAVDKLLHRTGLLE